MAVFSVYCAVSLYFIMSMETDRNCKLSFQNSQTWPQWPFYIFLSLSFKVSSQVQASLKNQREKRCLVLNLASDFSHFLCTQTNPTQARGTMNSSDSFNLKAPGTNSLCLIRPFYWERTSRAPEVSAACESARVGVWMNLLPATLVWYPNLYSFISKFRGSLETRPFRFGISFKDSWKKSCSEAKGSWVDWEKNRESKRIF